MNRLIVILVLIVVAASCRTPQVVTAPEIRVLSTEEILNRAQDREFDFEYLSSRLNINILSEDGATSVRADLRMKKDSIIWLSITPALGIEAVRVIITPDTMQILDRLNRQHVIQPFEALQKVIEAPVEYWDLQGALSGKVIDRSVSYQSDTAANRYVLTNEAQNLIRSIILEPEFFTITRYMIEEQNSPRSMSVRFSNYDQVGDRQFPTRRHITIISPGENTVVEIEFSRVITDQILEFPFVVNPNYEVIR